MIDGNGIVRVFARITEQHLRLDAHSIGATQRAAITARNQTIVVPTFMTKEMTWISTLHNHNSLIVFEVFLTNHTGIVKFHAHQFITHVENDENMIEIKICFDSGNR